jgi:rRNA maturation endonuclease Nob1
MKEIRDTPRSTMSDEEMVKDYPRLAREYTLLHQDYREAIRKTLNIPVVVCSACGAENSIRWDKHCIGIDDKQSSYKDLSFQFCEECGDVTNVDFS